MAKRSTAQHKPGLNAGSYISGEQFMKSATCSTHILIVVTGFEQCSNRAAMQS